MNEIIVVLMNSQGIVELQVIANDTAEAIKVVEKSEYAGVVVYAFGTDFTIPGSMTLYPIGVSAVYG